MKKFLAVTLLILAMVTLLSVGKSFAFVIPYFGTYYIWDTKGTASILDDTPVVKIEEDVYRFTAEELSQNTSLLSEWYYGYTVTNLAAPEIYSLHIMDQHPIVGATAPDGWSYDGSTGDYHIWSTSATPVTVRFGGGSYVLSDFGLWINDIHSDPNDGDHGYVPWNVDLGGQGMLSGNYRIDPVSAPVPEPTSMMLLGMGILGLAGFTLRRKA